MARSSRPARARRRASEDVKKRVVAAHDQNDNSRPPSNEAIEASQVFAMTGTGDGSWIDWLRLPRRILSVRLQQSFVLASVLVLSAAGSTHGTRRCAAQAVDSPAQTKYTLRTDDEQCTITPTALVPHNASMPHSYRLDSSCIVAESHPLTVEPTNVFGGYPSLAPNSIQRCLPSKPRCRLDSRPAFNSRKFAD
ncbi:hypothetical protein C8R45DRAFT_1073922 [Mycena sanguinolenta]|nr:hypothetical protein C8R45DRAFT_1073922 [Mycena sanguinolenta]